MMLPFESVPSARTALLYFEKYGSAFAYWLRSASWPLSPSVRASVNGTSNTVGSVPAASFAANVGAVHWYSTGLILMFGYFLSNCATCELNCAIAAGVLPGISEATLIVTVLFEAAAAIEQATTTSKLAKATVMAMRMDFIVLPFLDSFDSVSRLPGGARPSCLAVPHLLRGRRLQ